MTLTVLLLALAIIAHAWALAFATWLAQSTAIGPRAWATAMAGILVSGVHSGLLFAAVMSGELQDSVSLGASAFLVGLYFFVALWLARPVLTSIVSRAKQYDRVAHRYQSLIEALPVGVLLVEPAAGREQLFIFNSALARFLDLPGDESRQRLVDPLAHPDDLDGVTAQLVRLATSTQVTEEQRFVLSDGRVAWGVIGAHALPGTEGEPPATLLTVTDTTRQHHAMDVLLDERDRAHTLLDTVDVILVSTDVRGRVRMANQKASTVLGIGVDRMVGASWPDLGFREESRQLANELLTALVDGEAGRHAAFEGSHATPGDKVRVVSWRCTSVQDAAGSITGVLCAGIDVTERAEAMTRFRQERGRVEGIMETSPIAILVADREGSLVYANQEAEAMLGPLSDERGKTFVERAPWDIVDWNGREIAFDALPFIHVSRTGEAVRDVRVALQWPDGRRIRLLVNITPLAEDKQGMDGMVATLRDVTGALELDARARSSERMDALRRLALGVAHDFNNILTTVVGSAEIGLSEGPGPATPLFEAILRRALDATELTARLQSIGSSRPLAPVSLRVNELVDAARQSSTHVSGVSFEPSALGDHEQLRVSADRPALEVVITALLRNAREAAGAEGSVTVVAGLTTRRGDLGTGQFVEIAVTDSGPGIPSDARERMFEPYFSTRPGSAGLGLSQAVSVVRRLGGDIEVDEGLPTTLRVLLPVIDLSDTPAPPPARSGIAGLPQGSEHILLVEDEHEVEVLLHTMLTRQGYTVRSATTLAEARGAVQEMARLDLLLTDLLLPDGQGDELARELRERLPALPVLFTSGMPGDSFDSELQGTAPTVFVSKPFTASEIATTVRRVLDA